MTAREFPAVDLAHNAKPSRAGATKTAKTAKTAKPAKQVKQVQPAKPPRMQAPLPWFDQAREIVCGVDEAGRGPLAGPVFAAAVILDPARPISGLRDSKKLTPARRESLALEIRAHALSWAIAECSEAEIDELNILHASMLAMRRAIDGLHRRPTLALIDGNRCPVIALRCDAIVQGDDRVAEISAASILAKTARDAALMLLHARYPDYAFDQHKGYPTPLHLERLRMHGVSPVHRRSYAPVRALLDEVVLHVDLAAP